MNFYEQELRDFFGGSPMLQDVHYFGRTCLAKLDQDLRVKLQFTSTGYADHYNAIKLAIINRTDGVVDQQLFRFADIIGQQHRPRTTSTVLKFGTITANRVVPTHFPRSSVPQIANTILDYVGMYQSETQENDFSMKL